MAVRLIEAIANIEQFERLDSGTLKVTAIARTPGILTYFDSNGPRRELVTADFLRSPDQSGFPIAGQLADLPVTLEHPPSLLRKDDSKTKQYSVGKTGPKVKVYRDGRIQVEMEVEREDAITAIESGEKQGVSLGYLCNISQNAGTYKGERYDAEQCAPFEADHLAIVAKPRAKGALIKGFERTDDTADIAVAYFEEFEPSSDVVDSPRSDSMGTNTAATVAISDIAKPAMPETFQIDINGKPFHVDSAMYEALNAERSDMAEYKKDMDKKKHKGKKPSSMNDEFMGDDDEDDDEYEDGDYAAKKMRKDATEQISAVLIRCDADTLTDALYNLNVLVGRFDGADTVADVVEAIDTLQGRVDALDHEDSSNDDSRFDDGDVKALLEKLDAADPAAALLALEGKEFIVSYGHLLPPGYKLDGQTLHELQLEAIKHTEPGLELKTDSAESISGAFSVVANRHKRVDSSTQLDKALHLDMGMVHSNAGPNGNRRTNTSMTKKPSESLFALSKAVRRSGSK